MGYSSGINLYFLHSWAHNPFGDDYRPGWGFAHYGTHFSRNQTWFEPGKAFFTYLARCQMLLQQGTLISHNGSILHRSIPDAEIFFVSNPEEAVEKDFEFPVTGRIPELWDAYAGTIKKRFNGNRKAAKPGRHLNWKKMSRFLSFSLHKKRIMKNNLY
jgi:hypothetical protein